MDLMQQDVELLTAQFGTDKTVADQLQIAAELIDVCVVKRVLTGYALRLGWIGGFRRCLPAGFRHQVVALQGAFEPLQDVAELQPVGLQPVAGCPALVNLREAKPVHLQ